MKRFLLFFLCFLSLAELHANSNHDHCLFDSIMIPLQLENVQLVPSDRVYITDNENNTQPQSDVISTLTLVVNSLNNALTSANNQVTIWSLILSLITLIIAVVGIIGLVRLKKYEEEFGNIKKHLDYQQKKDELRDLYMERINNWMLDVNLQLANNLASSPDYNNDIYDNFKKTYQSYYLIKLSVLNIPNENKPSEEKEQAINHIQRAIDQIVEIGSPDDLKALQEMAEFEINKEKKKMLRKAVKKLQDRLINHV